MELITFEKAFKYSYIDAIQAIIEVIKFDFLLAFMLLMAFILLIAFILLMV